MDDLVAWIVDKLIPPAFVAVAFTFLTNLLVESHRAQRDALTKQVADLADDLMQLWEAGAAYWSTDADADPKKEHGILILEQDIRQRAMEISPRLEPHLPRHRMLTLLAGLLDAFTGDNFGDPSRKADVLRLGRMREAIVTFRSELTSARAARLRSIFRIGG